MEKAFRGMGMEGPVARWYEKTTRKDISEFRRLASSIAESLPPGSAILEVAPGPGFLSIELAGTERFAVTGLDISKTFVNLARRNAAAAGAQVRFEQGNASHMPFPNGSFDFVVNRAAFKNFSEPLDALREMHRVLKPGAHGLIIDLRRDASMSEIATYVDGLRFPLPSALMTKLVFRFMLLKRAYTKPELETMIAKVPFSKTEIVCTPIGMEIRFER